QDYPLMEFKKMMRRMLDITVAAIALLLVSPLLVLIGLSIVLSSPGSPFYLANRVGKDGRVFRMWKFRTMKLGASKMGPPITAKRDPRVIAVGHFLRRSKLDELPQFFNVLLGDMSLVGPRPEAPEVVAHYTAEQRQVLQAKPGMTGKVQIEG